MQNTVQKIITVQSLQTKIKRRASLKICREYSQIFADAEGYF